MATAVDDTTAAVAAVALGETKVRTMLLHVAVMFANTDPHTARTMPLQWADPRRGVVAATFGAMLGMLMIFATVAVCPNHTQSHTSALEEPLTSSLLLRRVRTWTEQHMERRTRRI